MTERTAARPSVRPRSGRRPLPPLIFLLVLAVAAAAVWWTVIRQDRALQAEEAAACAEAEEAPPALDPGTVSVRIFNATDEAGLAQRVSDQLGARGFTIGEVANDSSEREVQGVGEVRYGSRGRDQARFLGAYAPGVELHQDTRATSEVDLVLGPEFTGLAAEEEVAAAIEAGDDAPLGC
ncbi:LytR C-terminal domain-containing protein [Blastococcus sp. TF02A_35]|uniref:LytR C-terminal domain-containing protein n=1 Tax=Blastococcus sp. TF02A-35 TaxID=2559612 RepID=UPI0010730553|nr:LytR C-terminal domain-containing protein [Blastococcus sp. TF02A_35]TFV53194.1 LytR family transcriptional regulator [Blastococcus sp. TF02A_35]